MMLPTELLEPRILLSSAPPAKSNLTHLNLTGSTDVVLVDTSLANSALLIRAARAGDKIITFNGSKESPGEVLGKVYSWATAQHTAVSSLSILSHGQSGAFELGDAWISNSSLAVTALSWTRLEKVLAPSAVIDLYGCSVAAPGGAGQSLIDRIARLTGATVFASTNLTGKGGDWLLEAESAKHDDKASANTSRIFSMPALTAYPDALATITVATAAAASPSPVTGTTTNLSVLGASTSGESTLTYTWSATTSPGTVTYSDNGDNNAKNCTATFVKAGSYVFKCVIADSLGSTTTSSSVSVTVSQTFTSMTLTASAAAIHEKATKTCTAKGYDQFGVIMSTEPTWTWSVVSGAGTVASTGTTSGKYTAGSVAGTAVVQAANGSISQTVSITVTNASPTVATASAITPKPATGTTAALSVLGADDNGETNLTYTWAATVKPTGSNPTFSANGTNASKASTVTFNLSGSYTFVVTINDGQGGTVTSTVTETVSQTLTTIALSPTTATVSKTGTQQFTATGYDQFGVVMSAQPTFTWTVNSGGVGGTVSTSGLYTAPNATGADVVKATSGAVSATASVTVQTAALPATASPSTVTGTTTSLSALAAGDTGQFTYTWSTTGSPPAPVSFSVNGTNAAKTTVATFTASGTYALQVAETSGSTTTSSVTVTVNQTLTSITISPTSASLVPNQTQTFTASGLDQFGTAMASQPTLTWSMDNGSVGTFNTGTHLYTAGTVNGNATIRATSGSVAASAVVNVTDPAPTVATAAAASPSPVTGTTTTLSVLGADDAGASTLTYDWATTGSPPAPVTFSDNSDNAAQNVTATFTQAGTYNLQATIANASGLTVTSAVTVVVNQTLTTIAVTPGTASLGAAGTQSFTASGSDQFGNTMSSQPTFTWSASSGSINQSGNYTAPLVSASPTVTASSSGVSGLAYVTVTNAAPTVATAASATPSPVTAKTSALSVLGADDGGESNLTYTWATTGTPPAAVSFSANGTNASKNTTATFAAAGTYNLQVTITDSGGLTTTSSVSVTVNQTLTTITVSPSSSSLNENQTQQFSAVAYDQFGTSMSSQPTITWAKAAGVGSINSSGLYTAPNGTGSASITATSGSISGSASITVSNATPTVATAAAASPSPATGTTTALSVLGADDGGESNLTYTWATTGTPPAAVSFSANGTNASKNSTATFSKSGTYSFQVTIADAGGLSATSSVSVTVNQTLTTIAVSPGSASLNENAAQNFSAVGYDQFGTAMSSQPTFTWSRSGIGSVNSSSGVYTAPGSSGSAIVTAASAGVSGTASVTITNASPTLATAASASPTPVTGTTTALSVLGADDGGESNLTYTWSATGQPTGANPTFSANATNTAKNSTVTFDKAGSYTFTVTISDGQGGSTSSSVSVTVNQTLATITVSPSSTSLNENQTQQLSAVAYDQFGAAMSSQPTFSWSKASGVGSVNSSGLYTAPYGTGSASVTAASASISGSASITVANAAPTVATAASASPSPVTGTTSALSVLGADDGGESNLTYTWATTGTPPAAVSFSANGTNVSKNTTATFSKSGTYNFQVTITDAGGLSTTSSVSVTVNQTLTTITVSPSSSSLNENQTQQLAATGYDQFGVAMSSQPTFTWSKASGVGSINSSGLYAAPYGAGSATVTAASASVSGSASITTSNASPTVATAAAASPSPATGTTTALTVLGADDGGESNLTYTWATTGSPPAAVSFSANATNAAKNSTATFSKAGTYNFQVTIADAGGLSTTSSVSVVVNQTLTTISVSPSTSTLNENQTQQFAAVGYDQFGIAMSSQPTFTWSKVSGVGSVNSSGLYTAPNGTGSASINAISGAVSGSASISVSNATPTVATAASASPSPATGTNTALTVLGADDGGESNLTYTWATTGTPPAAVSFSANATNSSKNTTATFSKAGTYNLLATITDAGGLTTTSSVAVTVNQTLTSIAVSPGSATINENTTQNFSAVAYDQFSNAMASQPTFAWSKSGVGSINSSSGVYTSPGSPGTSTVTASSGGISGTANVTVSNASPTVATAASASPSPVTGTTTALSVLGADDGGEANLTYTWATTGTPPAAVGFSANGNNASKNTTATFSKAGTYNFQVTISDAGGLSTNNSVSVTVNQTLTTIALSPSGISLNENESQQFTANAKDQFGNAMATQPGFTWSVASGVGSISSSGLYTAPWALGSATIQAASGGFSGTAAVTVAAAPLTAPTNLTASASGTTSVGLTWQDTDTLAAGATILRSVDGAGFTTLTTLNPTNSASTVGLDVVDGSGDAGTITLNCVPSGLGDGSLWAISGWLTVTASSDTSDVPLGTYPLLPTPTASLNGTNSPTGAFQYDNLVYPGNNASIGSSTLTVDGLVFGKGNGGAEINVWGNGGGDYAFYAGYNGSSYPIAVGSGATVPNLATFSAASTYTDSTVVSGHTYSYEVVATNAGASSPPSAPAQVPIAKTPPTVATAAAANPNPVTGTTTALTVLGADDNGESGLTYAWTTTGTPPASVVFSDNGDNSAKNATATFIQAGNYSLQVTITNAWGLSTTSSVNVTVNQTLTTIAVSPSASSLNEDQTQQFSATGSDQFGNVMTTQPTFTWTQSAGIGSINSSGLYTAPGAAGSATVSASSGGVTGTATITVTNAGPTVATPASATPSPVTGTTTALSVLGADDNGEANLTYTWAATTEPNGSAPAFSVNGSNAAKNSTVTFNEAGNYTFTVTISDGQGGTATSSVNVTLNQTLSVITVSPPSSSLNENQTQQLSAVGYDQFGIAMASQPTFTWSKASGVGSINSSGLYTAPYGTGSASITATSGSVSGSASITISNAVPTVVTSASATPSTVTGTTTALSVLGVDDGGESNLTYTWATTGTPPAAVSFSANGTNGAKNTTATFAAAGTYNFQVTITDVSGLTTTSSVSVAVNQVLTTIAVSPSSSSLNENQTQQLSAVAYDQFGIAMASQPTFTWSKASGIGSINSSGLYTAPYGTGSASITATSGLASGSASVTVSNAVPTVATAASASPSPVTGTTTALSVLGADDGGESNLTYTWATTGTPPAAVSFSANGTNASKNATATFSKSGTYTFQVTITDASGLSTTSSVSVVVNQTMTTISVSPATSTVNENQTQQLSALGYDQFGIAMSSQPTFTWSKASGVGSINSSGLYTAPYGIGTASIIATSGSVSGSASITVNNAAPTVATAASASPSPVTGTTTALSVLGADDGGESNLTYTWATTGTPPAAVTFSANGTNVSKNTTATFSNAGTYNVQVTITDASGLSTTSSVSVVVNQTLTTISVTPATSAVNENQTQQLSAVGYDQFGIAMSSQPSFTWSKASGVGSINSSGLYTAPYGTGSASITATSGAVSGSASITVSNAVPTVVTTATASPSPATGTTTLLSVLGADDGGESNLTYTWATTGTPPAAVSFSANGTNASKNNTATFSTAGTYNFQVTITDAEGLSTTSSVSVTVNQALTTITVSPSSSSLNENQTQQLSAVGYDQFGIAMSSQPTFTWSKASGVGSIDASGLYTAPYGTGVASITATSGAVSGSASITISNAVPIVATAASASPSPVGGTTTALSVLGADDGGESNLTYTWETTGTPPATVSFSTNGTNASKNTTATFATAGTYNFQVTITDAAGLFTTSSLSVSVNQTLTAISVSPATSAINENQTQQLSAVGYDQFGIAMASQPSFTWSKASGIGSIDTSGLYTAPYGTGGASITATSGSVPGSASITVSNAVPTVATAASASPSPVTGTTTALSVLGADDGGEANLIYTWATTGTPPASVSFDANGTNGAKNTTATFATAGTYSFQVTITDTSGLSTTSLVSVVVNQTLTTITVSPPSSSLNENQTQQFSAVGYDQFGIAMVSLPTFSWSKASGIGSINSSGLYTTPYGTGSASITATSGAVSGSASITVSNAVPTVATPASANPSPVTGTTTALSVLGADDGGEPNLTYTWAMTGTPPAAVSFSANGTDSAKDTTATFAAAGTYNFQVTIEDAQGLSTTSSVNVVVNQTLTTISVSPATSSVNENQTQQLSAIGYDQFGIAMVSQPTFTWSIASGIGSVDSSGLYTAPYGLGSATISATSGPVSGSASIIVNNAVPTVATAASASPSPVTGTTTALSVLGADDGGEPNLTYTWATTGTPPAAVSFSANATNASRNSTATFSTAGTYNFQVTITDTEGLSTTSSVSVTVNQTLSTITVSPPSSSLNENQTQQFSSVGYDQFGNAMSSQPTFTWSKASGIGSIDSSGLYTAPYATGSASITATSGSVSGSASITVGNAVPTVAAAASASPSPVTGTTTALSVLGADDGGESNLTYTWATTGTPPAAVSFSANGANDAKNTTATFAEAGTYTFQVTITDAGGLSTTSSVNVTVNQTLTTISVSPGSASLNENATQSFSAVGYDQFGNSMAVQPTFSWSMASGVGSIDVSGLYTAPYGTGSATIAATSGSVSGSASITVSDATPTVAAAASATPSPVEGSTTALSVLGADDGGESNLTYTWAATAEPAGADPTFSVNSTSGSKNSTVTFDEAGTYTFTVTISDGQGGTTTSSVNVTVDQTLTTITASPGTTTLNENATQTFSAIGYDQFGNAMASQPTIAWSNSGIGNIDSSTGIYTSPGTSGTATITASGGSINGDASITISNAAPTVATAASASPSPVAGTTTTLSVLGADDGGESNLTYTWAATTEPAGANPTFSANGTNGSKTSTVTFDEAGDYTFSATISDGQGGTTTSSVNVTVDQTLTSIAVTPSTTTVNENATRNFSAVGYDQFGNAMASQPTIAWSSSGIGNIDSSSGVYTSPGSSGTATITGNSGSIVGTASITVSDATPTVATAASASPSPVTGTTTALSVLGADDGGESNLTYTWTATTKPSGANPIFSANGSNGSKNNTATFDQAGDYTFTATISDGQGGNTTSSVNVTVDQTLTTVTVSPRTASLNEDATQTFSAIGYDQFGSAMSVQPTFAWSKNAGIGSIDGSTGVYSAPATSGTATITATSGAVSGFATITIANAAPTVATPAAAATSPVTGTTSDLSVLGADDGGESNLTYTWTATTQPSAANPSFSANGTNSAKNSTVTFDEAGNYTFTVTISDGQGGSTTSSVNVTVNQTLTTIAVSPSSSSLNENQTQQFAAVGYDQFGIVMTSQPTFSWSKASGVGSIDSSGLYTAPYGIGSGNISATSASVSGSASITISNATPTVATAASASPSPVAGTTTALSVLGADDGGESNLTYTWAATAEPSGANPVFSDNGTNGSKNSTVTFDEAGTYTFTVTISDGQGATTNSSVSVTVDQTLASITVNPGSATLNENATQNFSAIGYDQFGNAMSTQPSFAWSKSTGIGAIDNSTGEYTSPASAGNAVITASSGSVSGSATVTVTDARPTVATAAAASPSPVTGTTTVLSALGADDGGEANLTYTWAASTEPAGAHPVFSVNGTNASKTSTATFDQAGDYALTVTIDDGQGGSTTSSVNVTVDQTLTSIIVSPGTAALNEGATQNFTAVGYDQFGIAMSTQPTFTWSKSSGIGSIDGSTGVYTSPATSGTSTITAASGSISGLANVTITNSAPTVATTAAASPSPVIGTTTDLSVLGADDGGESNLTYTWASTTQPSGANPTFSANGTNSAKDSTVTFNEAGDYTLTATISDGQGGSTTSSVNVTVNQTLTTIAVSPSSSSLNENQKQQFSAVGYDQFGNAMSSQPTFSWSKASGVGSIDSSGLYTAPYGIGSAGISATSGTVSGSATVTISNATPTVGSPALATPSSVTGMTTDLSVLGADDGGESNLIYTWAATADPAGATPVFSANGTNASKNSTVTFDEAGNYTFTVIINDGQGGTTTSSANVTVDQTLTAITVSPGMSTVNENAKGNFSAIGYDQFGTAMSTQPIFSWNLNSGIGSIDGSSGVYTSPGTSGIATITASSGSITGTANITITNAAPTVATMASASPSPVTGVTTTLSVLGADDGGESSLTYTWATTTEPNGANPVFSVNGTNTSKTSTVTFDEAGDYTFTVTISDGQGGSTTSSVNVTAAQTLTTIAVSPVNTTLNENATQSFSAIAYDQFGNALAAQPTIAWSNSGIGSIDPSSGLYTSSGSAGTAVVTATSASVSGTATVTVADASPTVVTAASASPSPVTGITTALSVLGADDGGESNLTYTWSAITEPSGANLTFSANGTNSAKDSTVTFDQAGDYTFLVTISDGQGGSITSSANVTVDQTLSSIIVSPATATINEDSTQNFSALGYDQFGNAMSTQPMFGWSVSAGIGLIDSTAGIYNSPESSGIATVTATSGSVTGTAGITITDAAPTVASPAAAAPSPVTGTTTSLSVLGADDGGEGNLTYTWAATAEPAGANPTFSVNGTNGSKNSTVTFDEAGTYTLTVTISDGQGETTTSSVNVPVDQTLTTITASPGTTILNENATQTFSAIGYDQFANAMASQPTIAWSNSGIGNIDSSSGVYTSPGNTGTATITASSGLITGAASITISNAAPTVATAASASPSPVAGTTTTLSVLGADDGGESNLTYTWAATTEPAGANPTFSANGTNGSKTSTVTFDEAGDYTFSATISDGQGGTTTSSVNVTVDQTLTSIAVTPSTTTVNENATRNFSAVGYDQFGKAMANQPTIAWSSSGIGNIDSSSGVYTSPGSSGTATITGNSGSIVGTASITVSNATPTVATAASASPSPVTGTTTALSVLGADDGGESNLTYTWAATAEPSGANPIFSDNGTNGSKNNTATFDQAGDYTFTVTISDGQGGSTTSSVNVTVDQTLATITVSPVTATVNENATQNFSAIGFDQFGNAMSSQPSFGWTRSAGIGSIDGSTGVYTSPGASGTATISASSGGVSGTATVAIANSFPTVVTTASATPSPVTGLTTALSVLGSDDGGESNLTYTWTATTKPSGANPIFSANSTNAAKSSTVTFDEAGDYTFTVTISDAQGANASSSVALTVDQTLTSIQVSPGSSAIAENGTKAFSAIGYDQFGNAMVTQPTFTWSNTGVGSIDAQTGLFASSGVTGTAPITATSGAIDGTTSITVYDSAPVIVNPASAASSPSSDTAAELSVLASSAGGESNLIYTWRITSQPSDALAPGFSLNGTNAAKDTTATFFAAGTYTFNVTVSDGALSTSSSVTIRVDQVLTQIAVVPGQSAISIAGTQQISAIAYDQFGKALATQPTFNWMVTAGNGTIDPAGQFTAPSAAETDTISASSSGVSGSANVVVYNQTAAVANPATVTGTSTTLTVVGLSASNLTFTWSLHARPAGASIPTFSQNASAAAQTTSATFSASGLYVFDVSISGGITATVEQVSVSVIATPTTLIVTPARATISKNGAEHLSATVYDQFGIPLASQPALSWTLSAGTGSVDSNGNFAAAASAGQATVVATSGALRASALVTVDSATALQAAFSSRPVTTPIWLASFDAEALAINLLGPSPIQTLGPVGDAVAPRSSFAAGAPAPIANVDAESESFDPTDVLVAINGELVFPQGISSSVPIGAANSAATAQPPSDGGATINQQATGASNPGTNADAFARDGAPAHAEITKSGRAIAVASRIVSGPAAQQATAQSQPSAPPSLFWKIAARVFDGCIAITAAAFAGFLLAAKLAESGISILHPRSSTPRRD